MILLDRLRRELVRRVVRRSIYILRRNGGPVRTVSILDSTDPASMQRLHVHQCREPACLIRFPEISESRLLTDKLASSTAAIIKCDDLRAGNMDNFLRFFEIMIERDLSFSVGLICSSIPDFDPGERNLIENIARIAEFWYHGLDHKRRLNPLTPFHSSRYEFFNTGYGLQKEHLTKGLDLASEVLGLKLRTFGAPYNRVDIDTARVLAENETITTVFFKPNGCGKMVLEDKIRVEYCTGRMRDADDLKRELAGRERLPSPVVLEIHPDLWLNRDFVEFESVLDFMRNDLQCVFTSPYSFFSFSLLRKSEESPEAAPKMRLAAPDVFAS